MNKLAAALALFCIFVIAVAAWQQTPMNSVSITNSTINSTNVGPQVPGTGNFTTLNASGASTLGPNVTVNGSVTASGGFLGNASSASQVPWAGVQNKPPVTTWNWVWSGQAGQPSWLWGSNDGQNMYAWNPGNFSVNYATKAGTMPWGGLTNIPYPVSNGQAWHWALGPGNTPNNVWGSNDSNNMYVWNPATMNVGSASMIVSDCCAIGRFKAWMTGAPCSTGGNGQSVPSGTTCTGTLPIPGPAYTNGSTYFITCSGNGGYGWPQTKFLGPYDGSNFQYGIFNGTGNLSVGSTYSSFTCFSWGN